MRSLIFKASALAVVALFTTPAGFAQPPGITMDMINTTLPLEGAPLAEPGPYEVISETAFGEPRYVVYRPTYLAGFPSQDTLPVLVWGNGGCAWNNPRAADFLSTIASHGFLVVTTQTVPGTESGQQTVADLVGAIDWAESENSRSASPLSGRIDTSQFAAMGQSCGGMLSVGVGTDERVKTIGVFNSGVSEGAAPGRANTDDLAANDDPVLFINGHERDFMMENSRANFDSVNHVPTFYGARHGAGHTATLYHPGGGEYANVASNWLLYQFKNDRDAARMFVGSNCSLCTNPNWDTDAKGLN